MRMNSVRCNSEADLYAKIDSPDSGLSGVCWVSLYRAEYLDSKVALM